MLQIDAETLDTTLQQLSAHLGLHVGQLLPALGQVGAVLVPLPHGVDHAVLQNGVVILQPVDLLPHVGVVNLELVALHDRLHHGDHSPLMGSEAPHTTSAQEPPDSSSVDRLVLVLDLVLHHGISHPNVCHSLQASQSASQLLATASELEQIASSALALLDCSVQLLPKTVSINSNRKRSNVVPLPANGSWLGVWPCLPIE